MLRFIIILSVSLVVVNADEAFNQDTDWQKADTIYQFHAQTIDGKDVSFEKYRNRVVIVVNVASNCGLTKPNYEQLQSLYEKYEGQGLSIMGFPANDFANQEPGTAEEISNSMKTRFGVTFDMYNKVQVTKEENCHPFWKYLKTRDTGSGNSGKEIVWNFTKFLVDRNGKVVARFEPATKPFDMEDTIKKYL